MHIEITPESLVKQLRLSVSDASLKLMEQIMEATKGSQQFFNHLFSLNDALTPINAFVAPSNSVDLLKIKYNGEDDAQILSKFHEAVDHWSKKYKVEVEKVHGKETYYIKGLMPK